VARPPFPKTLRQFQTDFATDEACQQYLAACRWPDGFTCPRCGHGRAYELANQRRHQCAKCRHQVSLTSGTVLHRTKIPLTHWFWAAYLMTTDKRGVYTSMNSSFGTIAARRRLPPFRHSSVSEPAANQPSTSRSEGQEISTTIGWG